MLRYRIIRIYTSENAEFEGAPSWQAIIRFVGEMKIAARCLVHSATAGTFENGECCTPAIEVVSFNRPLRIDIILPRAETEFLLPRIREMVAEGLVTVENISVVAHKTRKTLFPKHLRIRDVMTSAPRSVAPDTPLIEVVKMLIEAEFHALPVTDANGRPVGIITQGDLQARGKMPFRLGLLARFGSRELEEYFSTITAATAQEVMTGPVTCARADEMLATAVGLMLDRSLKRIPIIDINGKLTGVLSRFDLFRAISSSSPSWEHFEAGNVQVSGGSKVKEILTRDEFSVSPDCPLKDLIDLIVRRKVQRIPVVDRDGRLLGLIIDKDLLTACSDHEPGLWAMLMSRIPFFGIGEKNRELLERSRRESAADFMKSDLITIREETEVDEAIRVMKKHALKRLPVVDAENRFLGLISRDALLRAGFQPGS